MAGDSSHLPVGYACRRAVAKVLAEHYKTGQFLKSLFDIHLNQLSLIDQNLAREISLGCVRWQRLLDHNIRKYLLKQPGSLYFKAVARLTAYQFFFLNQVPDYAACNIGVELLKRSKMKNLAPVVNAIFKKLINNGLQYAPGSNLKALSINTSHPLWLVKKWAGQLTPQQLAHALKSNNHHAFHWFRINTGKTDISRLLPRLQSWNPQFPLPGDSPYFAVEEGVGELLRSRLFLEGLIAVQDPAAWFIDKLLQRKKKEWVLDFCGAPGGKSTCMAEQSGTSRRIICADLKFERIYPLIEERQRLGHRHIQSMVMDGLRPAFKHKFPKILIDAPCSNLGVLSHRPEARWTVDKKRIQRLSQLQLALLNSGASLCEPSGVMVYATCSPDKTETAEVIHRFIRSNPLWKKDDAGSYIPSDFIKDGFFWQYPGQSRMGGFFAARLLAPPAKG